MAIRNKERSGRQKGERNGELTFHNKYHRRRNLWALVAECIQVEAVHNSPLRKLASIVKYSAHPEATGARKSGQS